MQLLLGEMTYGSARGMKDLSPSHWVPVWEAASLPTVELIYGHDGFAGELGHVIVIPGGRFHPGTGCTGSLEAYASATGVTNTATRTTGKPPG